MSHGWNRVAPEAWELACEYFPRPWPRELAEADLEHHRSATHRGKKFPGRPTLMARWGWTEWAVRDLVRTVNPLQQISNGSPADLQPPLRPTPTIGDESPARLQPASSEPPSRDPLLEEVEEDQQLRAAVTEAAKPEAVEAHPPAEPAPPEAPSPVQQVWGSWKLAYEDFRTREPRWKLPAIRKNAPNRAEARAIGGRLGEGATVEECQQVVTWALRDGTDDYARMLRGEHTFDSLKPAAPYPDVETLFKPVNWSKRLRLAVAAPVESMPVDSPEAEAQRAWAELPTIFNRPECRRGVGTWPDEVFGSRPEVQRAFRRTLLEHGGGDMSTDDFTRRRFVASFVKNYQARSAS